ncbi:MAG: hypothetical protein HY287_10805 [Planctomycetes bacterium]|nr:hypothetical protein [Planctomycetota bacterium]MBI3834808.1 hypothetical protein [Planctomycetota bacterium]
MIRFLEILVVLVMASISMRAFICAFTRQYLSSADLVCSVLFFFYGLPLVYEWFAPAYVPPWFIQSTLSADVALQYCFVLLAAVLLIKLGEWGQKWTRRQRLPSGVTTLPPESSTAFASIVYVGAWLILLLPLPAVLASGMPQVFLIYGDVVDFRVHASPAQNFLIGIIQMICLGAVLSFLLIDFLRGQKTRSWADPVRWVAFALAAIAVYLNGKRALAFALGMTIIMVRFFEGRLRLRTCVILGMVLVVGSYAYLGRVKGSALAPLEFLRGDMARDYTLRHVLYRSTWTSSLIVPYRGASYVFFGTAFIPRSIWPAKPWPAPVYFTNDVFGRHEGKQLMWGYGLGFLEELILNFGYFGVLGCLLIGRVCAWLDRRIYGRSSFYGALWIPLVFSCVFSSSVVLDLLLVVALPALLLRPVFARRAVFRTVAESAGQRGQLRPVSYRQHYRQVRQG